MTLHGHKPSYVDSGSGEAILFVHGLLGSHRNWRHLVDRLDNTNRVIVPDLFGHGASEKHEGTTPPPPRPPPCGTSSTAWASTG